MPHHSQKPIIPQPTVDKGQRIQLKTLPADIIAATLDKFAEELHEHFEQFTLSKEHTESDITSSESKIAQVLRDYITGRLVNHPDARLSGGQGSLPHNWFHILLAELWSQHLLKISPRVREDLSNRLVGLYGLRHASVVGETCKQRFGEVGAAIFMAELVKLSKRKPAEDEICVGLVSGTTVGKIVDYVCGVPDWLGAYGLEAATIRRIRFLPINASLTTPDHLGGNATILAYMLASEFRKRGATDAKAFGLNAPLLVTEEERQREDGAAPNKAILSYTEPWRAGDKDETKTKLDILLTGVGGRPPSNIGGVRKGKARSIFADGLVGNPEKVDGKAVLEKGAIIGDLAFIPLGATGEEVAIDGIVRENEKAPRLHFYSAVGLETLRQMADDNDKAVILLAYDDRLKVPAISAAIGGAGALSASDGRRYVSHLVTDEATASILALSRIASSDELHGSQTRTQQKRQQ